MIDPSKLGLGVPTPSNSPQPTQSSGGFGSGGTGFQPMGSAPQHKDEAPWDTLGRLVWGTGQEGGILGQVPVLGDIGRLPGEVARNAAAVGTWGVSTPINAVADVLGHIPGNLGDPTETPKINPLDATRYPGTADGGAALVKDIKETAGNNLSLQFMLLGQWQKENDPDGYERWQATLEQAKKDSVQIGPLAFTKAGEIMSKYIRETSVEYVENTSKGTEGLFDVMPELAYGNEGSLGQTFADGLSLLMLGQRKAEKGLSVLSGHKGGLFQWTGIKQWEGPDQGKRMNEILALPDNELTPIELQAKKGVLAGGWTPDHAYNFLVSHGQGFSSNAPTQLAAGIALDPVTIATLGAADAATMGNRVRAYATTAESASRIERTYTNVAKAIGTTVAGVRNSELGPAFKVARTIIDPFSALGSTPKAAAQADVMSAVSISGAERGFGPAAVADAGARAKRWGVREIFDNAYGVSAVNFLRKWAGNDFVAGALRRGTIDASTPLTEEMVQGALHELSKDAATRLAGFVQKQKAFLLSATGEDALAQRIAKMVKQPIGVVREEMKSMSPDELAVWHSVTYSSAFADFRGAISRIVPEAWGKLASKADDLTILNPQELDAVAAQSLVANLRTMRGMVSTAEQALAKASKKTRAAKEIAVAEAKDALAKEWNAAADRYSMVDSIGRVGRHAETSLVESRINRLDKLISEGGLHNALNIDEIKSLPKELQDFIARWTDADGNSIWRLGFKPDILQSTGLGRNEIGDLFQAFQPMVENVTDALPRATGMLAQITDPLGRIIPQAVKDTRVARAAGQVHDSLDVIRKVAMDNVTGERLMTSMEQRFARNLAKSSTALSKKAAHNIFRMSRDYAQERGFTIAALSPDDFWKATETELHSVVDQSVAKREVYEALIDAAGGDARLLGLSNYTAQRIRSGLLARGLDPKNYMGKITIDFYNKARYALNAMYFLQSIADAPWFLMYRGVMPDLLGRVPKEGTPLHEMYKVMGALGHTGMFRDLGMDYTERVISIGWQQEAMRSLGAMPGVKETIASRLTNWAGRMVMNNELLYVYHNLGEAFMDSLKKTQKIVDEKIAAAASDEERLVWQNARYDQVPMLDHLREQETLRLGRPATDNEVGLRYLSEMIDDSRLVVKTPEGMVSFKKLMSKGEFHKPTNVGQLASLDLDYGAEALGIPNIHSAADLRAELARPNSEVTLTRVKEIMRELDFHPDAIKRFTNAIQFNWREYFDGMAHELGMTRTEMTAVEDMIGRAAKAQKMTALDYFTQVMPLTARSARGVDGELKYVLDVMRLAEKGEAGIEELSRLAIGHLQPSMKERLLQHFMDDLQGPTGQIQRAMDAGDTVRSQRLQQTLEDLRGGWGDAADNAYKDMVIKRAGGANIVNSGGKARPAFAAAPGMPNAEMVPTSMLDQFMEIDREAIGKGVAEDATHLDALTADIKANGFKEPVTLEYDPHTGTALLTDGNHRLAVAKRLGMKEVPVEVKPAVRLASEADLTKAPTGFKPVENAVSSASRPSDLWNIANPIGEPEVERGAQFFADWLKTVGPSMQAGETLKGIIANIPTEAASPYNFTEAMLMHTLTDNVRLLEKDAIYLANINMERNVLERSLNHPLFAMYPTSYFWGKVIPETFRFIAKEPFGIKTTAGLEAYYKVMQTVALQSQYDPKMAEMWNQFGKSSVVGLLSYISPGMPWEDMNTSLPPWARALAKGGDAQDALNKQFDMINPQRWYSRPIEAGQEGVQWARDTLTPQQNEKLQTISGAAQPPAQQQAPSTNGTVHANELAPTLEDQFSQLQRVLSGR